MCKFHRDLATEIAIDPKTGLVDEKIYALTLTALAKYWIVRYLPDYGECDGEFRYEMATQRAQDALRDSALNRDIHAIKQHRARTIPEVRGIIANIAGAFPVDLPARKAERTRFLDNAYLHVFSGDPAGDYRVSERNADDPRYEMLRRSTAALMAMPGVDAMLETMLRGKIVEIFTDAHRTANPTLLRLYESLPQRLQDSFRSCAACAGGAGGGAALGHAGCVAAMGSGFIPVAGAVGSVATLGLSASFTAAVVGTWYYLRGRFAEPLQQRIVIGSAIVGTALAGAWHLSADGHHGHAHAATPTTAEERMESAALWLSQQSPETLLESILTARELKMSLEEYAASICSTVPPGPEAAQGSAPTLRR